MLDVISGIVALLTGTICVVFLIFQIGTIPRKYSNIKIRTLVSAVLCVLFGIQTILVFTLDKPSFVIGWNILCVILFGLTFVANFFSLKVTKDIETYFINKSDFNDEKVQINKDHMPEETDSR